ncbi:hypothetical protein EI427_00575 [Flammeovirga pectinis]|uniref:YtxH domain-containing protein n=1 Tax=Flammeovirga pectinis TaxID=2494373 RepID=A0A3S9NY22_9BACT|nr:DUF6132 family protein [Flammeovirga pectinis]AZQ60755.1 hypothetical protein EI427_00575 [Flammeovirga pectinis]
MNFIIRYKRTFIGLLIGSILGYMYYFYIGCTSGTCPITSNPIISVLYGGLIGSVFSHKKNDK